MNIAADADADIPAAETGTDVVVAVVHADIGVAGSNAAVLRRAAEETAPYS